MTPEPVLVFDAVGKVFHDHPGGTIALTDVSLTVAAGAFTALVGSSGAGKSTLLRLAADLIPPTTGTVRVCGQPPAEARRARQIGMVFQAPVLLGWRTVLGNVELPLLVAGVRAAERRRRSREVLSLVGLADVESRYPRQLSGGMRHRAAIARALITHPKLLLMDEPFAALDELTRERLNLELLRIWRETGVTVLFVTHHIEEAVFLADRVAILSPRPGTIVAEREVRLARPRGEETRQLPAFFETVNDVRVALHAAAAAALPPPPEPFAEAPA